MRLFFLILLGSCFILNDMMSMCVGLAPQEETLQASNIAPTMTPEALSSQQTTCDQDQGKNIYLQAVQYSAAVQSDQDKEKIFDLVHQAAVLGYAEAQYQLGHFYDQRLNKNPDNIQEVLKWWTKAAEQEHVGAQFNLATLYHFGEKGVLTDLDKAVYLYKKVAEQGHIDAQFNLGTIYYVQLDKDPSAIHHVIKWWTKAAEQGDAQAQDNLSILYIKGFKELPINYDLAAHWLLQRILSGDTGGFWSLALVLNHLSPLEEINLIDLYKTARPKAEAGDMIAQYLVGAIYLKGGEGFKRNNQLGAKWLSCAADQGFKPAIVLMHKLLNIPANMTVSLMAWKLNQDLPDYEF